MRTEPSARSMTSFPSPDAFGGGALAFLLAAQPMSVREDAEEYPRRRNDEVARSVSPQESCPKKLPNPPLVKM